MSRLLGGSDEPDRLRARPEIGCPPTALIRVIRYRGWVMAKGRAERHLIGGNLSALSHLHGTEYMPDLAGSIVFIEDDFESLPHTFHRDLTSLT